MSRPDQVLLIVVVFGMGVLAGVANHGGGSRASVVVALLALLPTAVSVHGVNEYADAETDRLTRRTAFSGGSGALHDLALPRRFALRVAAVSGLLALAVGALGWAVGALSPAATALLLLGLGSGWLYSVGPFPFSRHGWGEVVNAALGGLLLPAYGVASVTGSVRMADVVLFVPFALLAFANLLETQWPDREADRAVGKRTLVTRMSAEGVRTLAATVVSAAYGLVVVLTPELFPMAVAVASMLALPLSLWGLRRLTRVAAPLLSVLAMIAFVLAQGTAWLLVSLLRG